MAFPWMKMATKGASAAGRERRLEMYRKELTERAGLFYRLGYPPSRAARRLKANVAWDFEVGTGGRPRELADKQIDEIVKSTYLRRPAR